jgi:hypothetical protein
LTKLRELRWVASLRIPNQSVHFISHHYVILFKLFLEYMLVDLATHVLLDSGGHLMLILVDRVIVHNYTLLLRATVVNDVHWLHARGGMRFN